MRLEEMSCIDCGVKKCDSKTEVAREEFPPFPRFWKRPWSAIKIRKTIK